MPRIPLIPIVAAALALLPAGASAATIYGLTSANQGRTLVTFDSDNPGDFLSSVEITGDLSQTASLFTLDFRPSTGTLYALSRNDGGSAFGYMLYTLSFDGVTSLVGDVGVDLSSENAAFDFDPLSDTIRVVTNGSMNFSIDPNSALATRGADVFYPNNDPNRRPLIEAAAYTSSGQLFVLDRNGELLSTQDGDAGTLQKRGDLFTDGSRINANSSFDIAPDGTAFFNSGIVRDVFYRVDLNTGAAIEIGRLEDRLTAITVAPGAVPEPGAWAMMIAGFGLVGAALRRRSDALQLQL